MSEEEGLCREQEKQIKQNPSVKEKSKVTYKKKSGKLKKHL